MQKNAKVVTIDGYEDVPVNSEKALQKAVANQVVSIGIKAGSLDFFSSMNWQVHLYIFFNSYFTQVYFVI